jgi:hypothetical protein
MGSESLDFDVFHEDLKAIVIYNSGSNISVNQTPCKHSSTIYTLKQQLEPLFSIPGDLQVLKTTRGLVLEDDKTIEAYQIDLMAFTHFITIQLSEKIKEKLS